MDSVLLIDSPSGALFGDSGVGPLMLDVPGGTLAIGQPSPGVLLLDSGETFLAPQQTSTFMLAAGQQGPPGSQEVFFDPLPASPAYPAIGFALVPGYSDLYDLKANQP